MYNSPDAPKVFHLESDCLTDTIIYDEKDKVLFTIKTRRINASPNKPVKIVTDIGDRYGEIIAQLEWNDFLTDTLILKGSPAQSVDKWLKRSILPFKNSIKWEDKQGRTYKWNTKGPKGQYQLLADDYSAEEPIAWYRRNTQVETAALMMLPRAAEISEQVVIAFVCLEKAQRFSDQNTNFGTDDRAAGDVGRDMVKLYT